ncbi:TRAFAC clade GTPase domain-containing protein [Caldiplasma sukawensis]
MGFFLNFITFVFIIFDVVFGMRIYSKIKENLYPASIINLSEDNYTLKSYEQGFKIIGTGLILSFIPFINFIFYFLIYYGVRKASLLTIYSKENSLEFYDAEDRLAIFSLLTGIGLLISLIPGVRLGILSIGETYLFFQFVWDIIVFYLVINFIFLYSYSPKFKEGTVLLVFLNLFIFLLLISLYGQSSVIYFGYVWPITAGIFILSMNQNNMDFVFASISQVNKSVKSDNFDNNLPEGSVSSDIPKTVDHYYSNYGNQGSQAVTSNKIPNTVDEYYTVKNKAQPVNKGGSVGGGVADTNNNRSSTSSGFSNRSNKDVITEFPNNSEVLRRRKKMDRKEMENTVALLGPPSSGKTTFLAFLYKFLNEICTANGMEGAVLEGTDILKLYMESLIQKGQFPNLTASDKPKVVDFMFTKKARFSSHSFHLRINDIAGENFNSIIQSNSREEIRSKLIGSDFEYILYSRAYVFFFPLKDYSYIVSRDSRMESEIRKILESRISNIKPSVCIMFTMSDTLPYIIQEKNGDELLKIMSTTSKYLKSKTNKEIGIKPVINTERNEYGQIVPRREFRNGFYDISFDPEINSDFNKFGYWLQEVMFE